MSRPFIDHGIESYQLVLNREEDREFLETLGINEINVNYFLKGSYEERAKYLGRQKGILDIWSIILILLLVGSGYSLFSAIDGWVYGYVLFGIGALLSLLIIFGKVMSRKTEREDPLNIKTKESINYVVLKSIEFFTKEFSLIEVDRYVVDDFIQFHSKGIEMEFEDIRDLVESYAIDDPKEEIMAEYLKGILNPIEKK
ncbi:MAG: hypothetical protein GOP50_06820 [Candidatus Heimdallarchaeota archaeon]|nr:hypothetical protein [Candidatus Heimdallarchaeota archaeon]